jgi:hypothetical protein
MAAAEDLEVTARLAALREADAAGRELQAKLSVARMLLSSAGQRLANQTDGQAYLEDRAVELQQMLDEHTRRVDMLHEGAAACELRLALSRQCLADSGHKLEALRTRGGIAEEVCREKTIQLGKIGERLLERREQLRELVRFSLEQRVRCGLAQWRPEALLSDALSLWRGSIIAQAALRERLRGVGLLWQSASLHAALRTWKAARRRPGTLASLDKRRQNALRGLERAAEDRIAVTGSMATDWR